MRDMVGWRSRPAVVAAVALGGAAMLCGGLPSRGQQAAPPPTDVPGIQFTVPATAAASGMTRVSYQFSLPAEMKLTRNPQVRVLDAQGKLAGLLPMGISQRGPVWNGYRDMVTGSLKPGAYRVNVEVLFTRPDGTQGTAAAPASPMAVR